MASFENRLLYVFLLVAFVALSTQKTFTSSYTTSYSCIPEGTSANCSCFFNAKLNGTGITCKSQQLTSFPKSFTLPTDLKDHPIVSLELGMNRISHVTSGSLDNYPGIRYLILDNNNLDFIDDDVFDNLEELDVLILKDNPGLGKLPKLDIALEELDMSNTGLDQAEQPLNLKGLPGFLTDLYLDDNNLEKWPVEFPSSLQLISMKNNILKTVDDTGDDFRRLGELYLDKNKIQSLDSSVSSLPDGLLTLSLNFNPIRNIDNDYFHNFDAIKLFSVSHTYVDDISRIAFQGASPKYTEDEDVEIAFEYNGNLKRVFKETFDPFLYADTKYKSLTIKLTGSPLDCSCEMIWIPDLLANFSKMGLSPGQVIFEGSCTLPADISGRDLMTLKSNEIKCDRNDDDDSDDSAKNAAIVLGVLLALVCSACIAYFLYDRFYRRTYMTI